MTSRCALPFLLAVAWIDSIGTVLSRKNGFDLKYEDSEKKEEKFSCLHMFVCSVGSHDRFFISGMGDF